MSKRPTVLLWIYDVLTLSITHASKRKNIRFSERMFSMGKTQFAFEMENIQV